jgi:hypothetical protein
MRVLAIGVILIAQWILATAAIAQPADSNSESASAVCDFDDGQEITVKYDGSVMSGKDEPHNGKVWLPGGSPLTLFTQVALTLNGREIPVGAYSLYVIPGKKEWTLIVNKNVTDAGRYDEKQDVVRAPMELGEVNSPPKQLQASFAHSAPKVCGIRLYYEKTGAFADFGEK